MNTQHHTNRAGVTVIEVLFATGIVIFGLIGIASLISVAGRQASQANQVAEAQALARTWYSEFVTRGFNNATTWRWYNDQLSGSVANNFVTFANSSAVASATSVGSTRTAFRHAVCIDPGFFADATTITTLQAGGFNDGQAYRPGLFPFYQDNYDPASDPASPSALTVDMPRLLRLSLNPGVTGTTVLPAKLVEQIFMSTDDLATTFDEADKTLAATRVANDTSTRLQAKVEYSWLATLCPREFSPAEISNGPDLSKSERQYTLSIVVMHRRDKQFFLPTSSGVENVPHGERVLSVASTTGAFRNGSGGRILVTGSTGVSDRLKAGDWVMLTRNLAAHAITGRSIVCRWYRIIGMDAEPTISGATWTRSVIVDGPDWVFDDTNFPTQCVVLDDVVTVLERVIEVN